MNNASVTGVPTAFRLTKRERQVLELLAYGLTNKEIATRLALTVRTAETYIDRVFGKLGVSSRARAVIEARRVGLLTGSFSEAGPNVEVSPNNLISPLTPLIGREKELVQIETALENRRLVTVHGTGGVGKTRLAVQVGIDLLSRYADGVWLCDFSTVDDPQFARGVVANVLGVPESQNRALSESISAALKSKRALLIFDNCEHAVAVVAELADDILHHCPNVRIMATSRQPLGIIGEFVHRVQSLSIPDSATRLDADAAIQHSAIVLFTNRAQAIQERFTLTDDTAPVVAEICRRVDGIPLGIELAAARVNHLSIEVLAEKIGRHFEILSTGDQNVLSRQRTMRAVLDWSYDHLSTAEQNFLRRLATFVGGFTLELATSIFDGALAEADIFDLLAALIDKSLVQTDFRASGVRYRLLEATRQYAKERAKEVGEFAEFANAHSLAIVKLAGRLDADWSNGMPRRAWLAQANAELGNLQAALSWAFQGGGEVAVGQQIVGSLEPLWVVSAEAEGRRWVRIALDRVTRETSGKVRAPLELIACNFGAMAGEPIMALAKSALTHYSGQRDMRNLARAQFFLGADLLRSCNFVEGEALIRQALEGARTSGMPPLTILALQGLAKARVLQGDTSTAKDLLNEAQALCKEGRPDTATAISLTLAEMEFIEGSVEAALRRALDAAAYFRDGNISTPLVYALNNASAYLIALGRFDDARTSALEALALSRELGNASQTINAIQHLVAVAAFHHENSSIPYANYIQRVARLFGFVDAGVTNREFTRDYTDRQEYDRIIEVLEGNLGREQFEMLRAEGRAWREVAALREAVAL
ncbi:MAG TPA: LuxR C-terminal-related transcriptional regulator [Candidatus Binatia bacterium]|nr:LuxR C-terminal-related transcriptional regulator [Candidatus Binatia bacterium]